MNIDTISTTNQMQGKRRKTEYKYSTLEEIMNRTFSSKTKCNVFGVVTSFKMTAKVKSGNDYFSILEITDHSTDKILKIRLFHADEEFLPKVCSGDIVRFHRLVSSTVDANIVLTTSRGWSWVKWNSVPNDVLDRMEASSLNATITSADKATVSKLRAWFYESEMSTSHRPQRKLRGNIGQKKIIDVENNNYFDLLCEVLAVKIFNDSCTWLKVWDGTKRKHSLQKSESFTAEKYEEIGEYIPDEYMADVSVYDDHVQTIDKLKVKPGMLLKFTNLHAWPRQRDPGKEIFELVMHSGNLYGRTVSLVTNKEDLRILKSDLEKAKSLICKAMNESNATKSLASHTVSLVDTLSMLENLEESQSMPMIEDSRSVSEEVIGDKAIESTEIGISSNDSCGSLSGNLRCLHNSATVIDGDGPLKLTELADVAKSTVSLNPSKLFRVRIKIKSCLTAPEQYVCHLCPPTGMCLPAVSNDGHPLLLDKIAYRFVKAWRQVRGFGNSDGGSNSTQDSQKTADEDVQSSQWFMPVSEEEKPRSPLTIEIYHNAVDGSHWESMKRSDLVIRKRKIGDKKFSMLYLSSDIDEETDYSSRKLKKNQDHYDRVIRPIPLSVLTSSTLPAVALQDGVFYYSSPAFADKPTVPLLKDEALKFCENRVTRAMGSPVMVPQFFLQFEVVDDGPTELTAILSGNHAINFFHDLTPQEYLKNIDEYKMDLTQCISRLIEDTSWIECIVEKSSRASFSNVTHLVHTYKIINTRLKDDNSVRKF